MRTMAASMSMAPSRTCSNNVRSCSWSMRPEYQSAPWQPGSGDFSQKYQRLCFNIDQLVYCWCGTITRIIELAWKKALKNEVQVSEKSPIGGRPAVFLSGKT